MGTGEGYPTKLVLVLGSVAGPDKRARKVL